MHIKLQEDNLCKCFKHILYNIKILNKYSTYSLKQHLEAKNVGYIFFDE